MPGLPCSYGDVTRVDIPLPFFLRDDAFTNFKNDDYDWNTNQSLTVLVKKVKRSPMKAAAKSDSDESMQEDLEGCPLECPFDPNENFEEAVKMVCRSQIFEGLDISTDHYEAMDLASCRRLVKKIYEGDQDTVQSLCLERLAGKFSPMKPIYVACDGSPNAKDLVMIGFDDEKFLELRMMGPYKQYSTQLSLELFLAYHQHLPNVNHSVIHKHVHAIYEKLHGEYPSAGKVFLEFLWINPKELFEPPPPESSRVKVGIRPKMGDANPWLKSLWEEIEKLEHLVCLFSSSNLADLNRSNLSRSMMDDSDGIENFKKLLQGGAGPGWKKAVDFSTFSLETVLQRVVEMGRTDIDFTDRAWSAFSKCTTFQEYSDGLTLIFSSVESKLYRPFLLPSNTTIMGDLLKKCMTGKQNFRSVLKPSTVIEMVLDCGLNKLYKDYCFTFAACHLAKDSETRAFQPIPRMFRDSLNNIKKLHCVMEVLCLSKDRACLSITEQEKQSRILFQYFQTNRLEPDHTFHFDVPYNAVAATLSGLHPVYWNLRLESAFAVRAARTNAVLSRDFFVGHAKKFYVLPDGTIPRGYYLYVHRIAQRRV